MLYLAVIIGVTGNGVYVCVHPLPDPALSAVRGSAVNMACPEVTAAVRGSQSSRLQ